MAVLRFEFRFLLISQSILKDYQCPCLGKLLIQQVLFERNKKIISRSHGRTCICLEKAVSLLELLGSSCSYQGSLMIRTCYGPTQLLLESCVWYLLSKACTWLTHFLGCLLRSSYLVSPKIPNQRFHLSSTENKNSYCYIFRAQRFSPLTSKWMSGLSVYLLNYLSSITTCLGTEGISWH